MKTGRPMGRPPHVPTDEIRRQVDSLAAIGTTDEIICSMIGIDRKTLKKYYGPILKVAAHRLHAMLGESIYVQALGRDAVYDREGRLLRAEVPRSVAMCIFLAKVRLGYREAPVAKSEDDKNITITVIGGLPRKSNG